MLYFAYGSNLDTDQMRSRCPDAVAGPSATLPDHALVFTGMSRRWGGAVASVTPAAGFEVHGRLWELSPEDLAVLDRFEGHPAVYHRVDRTVVDRSGARHHVQVYMVPKARLAVGRPSPEYLALIRAAYRSLGFDAATLGPDDGGECSREPERSDAAAHARADGDSLDAHRGSRTNRRE